MVDQLNYSILKEVNMAKNAPYGDGKRIGAVKERSQFQTPSGLWAKRDSNTGQIMDVKMDGEPFKGVRRERK
tara:strand:- start:5203 stop:5418 length:216 start_codon:yes stop_codon:yes gene_type:complete